MDIPTIEAQLRWTRFALAILSPIVGLAFVFLALSLLLQNEPLAAGVWMIAAMLSRASPTDKGEG